MTIFSIFTVSVVKRAEKDKSVSDPPGSGGPDTSSLQKLLQGLISISLQIPIVGGLLSKILEILVELILSLELLTNGAVARLLGGALPCEISLDNHFQCSGITKNGGLIQLLENIVDKLPELLAPEELKKIIKMLLRGLVAPLIDVLLGGEPILKS